MIKTCPHCGVDTDDSPRSPAQHRRFFAVVAAAYDQWPHDNQFQPDDPEHLRSYLLVRAGWKAQSEVRFSKGDPAAIEAAAITLKTMMQTFAKARHAKPVFVHVDMERKKIIGAMPRSIAYLSKAEMDHFEACRVFSRVDEIICATIGVQSTDVLLEKSKEAA